MNVLQLNRIQYSNIKRFAGVTSQINLVNARSTNDKVFWQHHAVYFHSSNSVNSSHQMKNSSSSSCSNYSTAAQPKENNGQSLGHAFYRSCDKATTEPVQGKVKGQIPTWLKGVMTRNGAGIMKVGNDSYKHLFDGMSVLHRYQISNGQATYSSRPLESDTYKTNTSANRIVVSEFGTAANPDPCKSIFQRLQSKFSKFTGSMDGMTDNCNVNVGYYGDQLYAMTETNVVRRIDPESLKSIGEKTTITDYVSVNHASAHPHVLDDGTMLNVGNNYRGKTGPHYCIIQVPPKFNSSETSFKESKVMVEFPFSSKRYPSYYHSFGMTKDKVIFIESPLRLDLLALAKNAVMGQSYASAMKWDPEAKARFFVASFDGKVSPVIYEADGFFTFHHINAYEEDDQIVVDVAGYNNGDVVTSLESERINNSQNIGTQASARRFILPTNIPKDAKPGENLITLKNSTATASLAPPSKDSKQGEEKKDERIRVHCTPQHLNKDWIELPRINYRYNGQKYNFLYGISAEDGNWSTPEPDNITKIDISKNETLKWSEDGMVPSEPIFVAAPQQASEDDGVILSALMHKNVDKAVTLLILNAKDMKELARVNFDIAGTFTSTFHGQYAQEGEKIHRY